MELNQRQLAEQKVREEKTVLFEFATQIASEVIAAELSGKLLPEELRSSWQDKADCLDIGDELFFPGQGDYLSNRRARSICIGCEVLTSCMRSAFLNNEDDGIKAGLSLHERRRFLAKARRETTKKQIHAA